MAECICGAKNPRPYVSGMYRIGDRGFDLLKCRRCGLIFVSPQPQRRDIQKLYSRDYFKRDYSCLKGYSIEDERKKDYGKKERYAKLIDTLGSLGKSKNLLEIGCSSGIFLEIAKGKGWNVTGVELSEWAAGHAPGHVRKNIRVGDFMDIRLDGGFDVVFMSHVLEHMHDPKKSLGKVFSLLRPKGLLIIEVPYYINSPFYRAVQLILRTLRIFPLDRDIYEFFRVSGAGAVLRPYHLFEYNPHSLCLLLRSQGFSITRLGSLVPLTKPRGGRLMLYSLLKLCVEGLNLPGGNLSVFAEKPAECKN
ncbi:MAG: class I SAM-dependent methyltransferase [archaeon]